MTQPGMQPEASLFQPETITTPTGERLALRFDVLNLLETNIGTDWQERVASVIEAGTLNLRDPDGHYTNREQGSTAKLGLVTADGAELAVQTPGLWGLYRGEFRAMMEKAVPPLGEPLRAYDDPTLALEGYAQKPVPMAGQADVQHRMEGHVDMRYTAVLVIDVPDSEADGGRLVISNDPGAMGISEINQDATVIKHEAATLLCFSQGRKFPHYTEEVVNPYAKRIVISMNYPTESEPPEAANELLRHIQGA